MTESWAYGNMKIKWKAACLLVVFILDIIFIKAMHQSYIETKNTLFLPVGADGEARDEVRRQFSGDKQIALTFDDGPHSVYTPRLLDGLRKRGVHATFFILGENVNTGTRPEYLRPPYGSWNDELECTTDMTVVLWNLDPLDWKTKSVKKIVRYIVKRVEPGDIILLHDVYPTSVEAALEVIDTLTKQGYTFVTVDELLID